MQKSSIADASPFSAMQPIKSKPAFFLKDGHKDTFDNRRQSLLAMRTSVLMPVSKFQGKPRNVTNVTNQNPKNQ